MHHRALVSLLAVAALAAALLGLVACGGSAGASADSAPALQGKTLQGDAFDLASLKGKPTIVNFFASWCPPCNSEAPDLVAFAKAHPEVQFVGVATNDAASDTTGFVLKYHLPYTIVMDPNGAIAGAWGADAIPRTVFVDANGRVHDAIVGAASREQFEAGLKGIQ
jgi:thiol-disulfide isomerase/thioredoxin